MRVKWNQIYTKGITLSNTTKINTLLFADDQVIIADSDDNLQKAVFTLHNLAQDFGMEISPEKSETMAVLRQDPVRRKSLWITNVYNTEMILNISVVKFPTKMTMIFN
jgi:hypothetical protein